MRATIASSDAWPNAKQLTSDCCMWLFVQILVKSGHVLRLRNTNRLVTQCGFFVLFFLSGSLQYAGTQYDHKPGAHQRSVTPGRHNCLTIGYQFCSL